jgi:hypothetical protein
MFYSRGARYFFYLGDKKHPKQINLCPYFRAVIGTMIIFPFMYAWNNLPESIKDHKDLLQFTVTWFIVSMVINAILYIHSESFWWVGLAMFFGMMGFVGLCMGLKLLFEKISYKMYMRKRNKMKEKPLDPQKPPVLSLVGEFIRSKHEKICPCVEFVDDQKVQNNA